jgi:hypothetical protein
MDDFNEEEIERRLNWFEGDVIPAEEYFRKYSKCNFVDIEICSSGVAADISEPQLLIHFVLASASLATSSCAPSSRATGVSFFAENRSTR